LEIASRKSKPPAFENDLRQVFLQSKAYPGFYNGGGSRGEGPGQRSLWDGSPPVGSRGKALVGGLGDEVPQKLKQNVKCVQFLTFPVQNVGFYEHKSRAWRVYFKNTQYKFF